MSDDDTKKDDTSDNSDNSTDDDSSPSAPTTIAKNTLFNKINLTSAEQDEVINEWNFKWRSRQRMAWTALITMIIVTLVIMFAVPIDKIDKLTSIITWFYGATATITITYMGTAAASNIFQMKFKSK